MSISLYDTDIKEVREYILSQFDKRFAEHVIKIRIQDFSGALRFVIRNDKRILQQEMLVRGEFNNAINVNHLWYHSWDEWVWMDIPCVEEN